LTNPDLAYHDRLAVTGIEEKVKIERPFDVSIRVHFEVGVYSMANDWIKERAEREAKEKSVTERQQEFRSQKNELIKALGPGFLKDLMESLNEAIVEWNSYFSDRKINGAKEIQGGYYIEKPSYPSGKAVIRFNPYTLRIEIELHRSRPTDGNIYKYDSFVLLEANTDMKAIHMEDHNGRKHLTTEYFTRVIIENIADPHSHESF